jgi:hypothetical protein
MNPWASLIDPPKVSPAGRVSCLHIATPDVGDRTDCALKLLRLGPLPWGEFLAITGWPVGTASGVLGWLKSTGQAYRENGEWRVA